MHDQDIQEKLYDIYLTEILVPALVEIPDFNFKAVSQKVMVEAARYLRYRRGASLNTIARHLGVSQRWVSQKTNSLPPDEPAEGWFMAILSVMTSVYPETLTADGLKSALLRQKRRMSFQAAEAHLELYCDLGKLERVGEEGYRAYGPLRSDVDVDPERIGWLRLKAKVVRPIFESYVRGDDIAVLGNLRGELDEACLEALAEELKGVTADLLQKYTNETRAKVAAGTANLIAFEGLIGLGKSRAGARAGEEECSDSTTPKVDGSSYSGSTASSGAAEDEGQD